jgi:hypothetical protein
MTGPYAASSRSGFSRISILPNRDRQGAATKSPASHLVATEPKEQPLNAQRVRKFAASHLPFPGLSRTDGPRAVGRALGRRIRSGRSRHSRVSDRESEEHDKFAHLKLLSFVCEFPYRMRSSFAGIIPVRSPLRRKILHLERTAGRLYLRVVGKIRASRENSWRQVVQSLL